MMKISNCAEIKKIFGVVAEVSNEAKMIITKEELVIMAISASNTSALKIIIKPSFFEEYNVTEESTLFFQTQDLKSILRFSSKNMIIGYDKAQIRILSDNKKFLIPLLENGEDKYYDLVIRHNTIIHLSSKSLLDNIKAITSIGNNNTIIFHTRNKNLFISMNDINKVAEAMLFEGIETDIKCSYDSKILMPVLNALDDDKIMITLQTNSPLTLTINSNNYRAELLIAPIINNED